MKAPILLLTTLALASLAPATLDGPADTRSGGAIVVAGIGTSPHGPFGP